MLRLNDGSEINKVLLIEFDQFWGSAPNIIRELGEEITQPGKCADKGVFFMQAVICFPA